MTPARPQPSFAIARPRAPAAAALRRHSTLPVWLLFGSALILAAGIACALAHLRARRAAARAHDLRVEAELQELIAEARAGEVAGLHSD